MKSKPIFLQAIFSVQRISYTVNCYEEDAQASEFADNLARVGRTIEICTYGGVE